MTETRKVVIQHHDFDPNDPFLLELESDERVLSVESGTRFNPRFRVWIEVPAEIAEARTKGTS